MENGCYSFYILKDTILGKIHFLLVRIKIKHMELAIIRREASGESECSLNLPALNFKHLDMSANCSTVQ